VHGGIIAALLDEAMVKLAAHLGIRSVSAELTVKFKVPAAPGEELLVRGRIVREASRLIEAEAAVERGLVVIAEATGKLLRV
jgi:acyl-coenzyme A thioesterase PaaI-like protein